MSRACYAHGCSKPRVKRWLCQTCYSRAKACPEVWELWPLHREGEPTAADVDMLADAWAARCAEVADARRARLDARRAQTPRRWRPWTCVERNRALELRATGLSFEAVGRQLDRAGSCVSRMLRASGMEPEVVPRQRSAYDAMYRRAVALKADGLGYREIAPVIGWPSSLDALARGVRRYRRRLAEEAR